MNISISVNPAVVDGKLREYVAWLNTLELSNTSVHVDVMRTSFVDNNAMTRDEFLYLMQNCRMPMSVHLMMGLKEVDEFIELAKQGRERVTSISIHIESSTQHVSVRNKMDKIRQAGFGVGLALNAMSRMTVQRKELFALADVITIMTVPAGASGQIPRMSLIGQRKAELGEGIKTLIVDGGVNSENIQIIKNAKIDVAVVGSHIYKIYLQGAQNRARLVGRIQGGSI